MKLLNRSKNIQVASEVEVASTYMSRLIGLLGRSGLPQGRALWITKGNSIHTWFMRFPIDVVFVDEKMKVSAVHENLGAWKMTSPFLKAQSVFELPAGTLKSNPVELGDELHVGN